MQVYFTKISDLSHRVAISRADGTTESIELESRSFLRHDLAHFCVEVEVPIRMGYWGCIASGASLDGSGVAGRDAMIAETLAGPVQTLMRTEAGPDAYFGILRNVAPDGDGRDLADRVHERVRRITGHWKGTPRGSRMELVWPWDGGPDSAARGIFAEQE